MANLSTFPTTIDTFQEHYTIQASDISNVQTYQQLLLTSNRTPDQNTQLANLQNTLRDKLILPDDINKLQDCITNLENFFQNNVDGYINQKQTEFDATVNKFSYIGVYNSGTTYMKMNTVSYNGQSYICLADNTVGQDPTNTTYWALIAAQGAQGLQGPAGTGLVFKGAFDNTKIYNVNDAVNYNGSLYGCIQQTTAGITPSNASYWTLAVAAGTSFTLTTLTNTATLASASSNVNIGIAQYNSSQDALLVYANSTFIQQGVDWKLNANLTSIDRYDGTSWASGTVFNFVVFKNMQNSLIYTDGSMLQSNSVANSSLATDCKVGSLASLVTNTKTDVVSAINEVKNNTTKGIAVAITASATSKAITFTQSDTNYVVSVSPAWNTTWWITSKSTTGCTINFGTAPASATTLDWIVER